MKEQCFSSLHIGLREVRHGRGVTVLSRDKTEVSSGVGRRWSMQEDGTDGLQMSPDDLNFNETFSSNHLYTQPSLGVLLLTTLSLTI